MSLRITDELIFDVLRTIGPATASQIYREIIRRDSTLPIDAVRQRAGAHIRSCLKFKLLEVTTMYGMEVFHFPGTTPILTEYDVAPNTLNNAIAQYLDSLPVGTELTYKDVCGKFHVHRDTVRFAMQKAGYTTKYACNRRVRFVKESV